MPQSVSKSIAPVMLALVACLSSVGCGYALAGRGSFLPAHIQIIGVPTFTNQTPYFELDQIFTEKVRAELIGRGRYKVLPDANGVDAVLSGQITGLTIAPVSFTQQQQASRYVATVTANISLRDNVDNKVLWQNPSLTLREEFDAASGTDALDPTAFFGQSTNALQRLSTEFGRTVVSSILEAF
jgi:lipopolysaccharide assembly LptE-like protein